MSLFYSSIREGATAKQFSETSNQIDSTQQLAQTYSQKSTQVDLSYNNLTDYISQYQGQLYIVGQDPNYQQNGDTILFSNKAISSIREKRNQDVVDMNSQQYIIYTTGLIAVATLLVASLYIGKS
jgi:hypothetical protein